MYWLLPNETFALLGQFFDSTKNDIIVCICYYNVKVTLIEQLESLAVPRFDSRKL